MELRAVLSLAESLMAEHGLRGWRLTFDNARRRAGRCEFRSRTISLSRHLMTLYAEPEVRDTVLHEIAHALVGPEHGHDAVWRAQARRIGCSGTRLVDASAPSVPGAWLGTCPRGHTVDRHRRPERPMTCVQCDRSFNPDFLFRWTFHGRPVRMGTRYERELAMVLGRYDEASARQRTAPTLPGLEGPSDRRTLLLEASALGRLPAGTPVRITVPGRYHGLRATVERAARTRYHLRGEGVRLTVSFAGVEPVTA